MTTPEEQQGPTVRHPDEVGTDVHVEPEKEVTKPVEKPASAKTTSAKTTPAKSDK